MNTDREVREIASEKNAQIISHELNKLENSYQDHLHIDYQKFWNQSREISDLFKTLKPLSYEVREALWSRFNGICEEVKDIQREQKEEQSKNSAKKKEYILSGLSKLILRIPGSLNMSAISEIQHRINQLLLLMKNEKNDDLQESAQFSPVKLTHDDQNECWTAWKSANDLLREHKTELMVRFYISFKERADQIKTAASDADPYIIKEQIRQFQTELKNSIMESEQFREIRAVLDEAWTLSSDRIQVLKKETTRRALENVDRWEQLIINNELIISQLENQIEECQVMLQDATSYDFAMKVKGWIEDKTEKIGKIKETILDLKQRILTTTEKYGNPEAIQ